jgi:hypothetical protein
MHLDLGKKAMLVGLKISQWTARKFDAGASREVWDKHNAKPCSGRFSKALMPGAAEREAITRNANEARAFHYSNTLPWEDDGLRILPAANYLKYSGEMAKFKNRHESLVKEFAAKYPALKKEAKKELGTLFSEDDYPSDSMIKGNFSFQVAMRPMVVSDDFRCQLGDDEVKKIQQQISAEVKGAMQSAAKEVWDRLYGAVKKMADTLHEPDKIFRDTLVGNIQELVDTLPRLNVMDDPALTDIIREVKDKLAGREPDKLRKDAKARKSAEAEANGILAKMAGLGAVADEEGEQ